jgi:hypothetical protein
MHSSEEIRKAHLAKQIAFVCTECEARVRREVELRAEGDSESPRATA